MTQSRRYLVRKISKLTCQTGKTPRFLVCIEEKRGSRMKYYGDCGRDGLEQDQFIRWCEKQEKAVQVIIIGIDKRAVQTTLGEKQGLYFVVNDYLSLDALEQAKRFLDTLQAYQNAIAKAEALEDCNQQIALRKSAIEQPNTCIQFTDAQPNESVTGC